MTITVKITETNVGYKEFETYEEAQQWVVGPKDDYEGITWGDGWIDEMEILDD